MDSPQDSMTILFFVSFLLFIFPPPFTNASSHQFVDSVCKQTINNFECLKAFKSDTRSASASNYKQLAPIAFDLGIANAKESEAFINNLKKTNPSEAVKQCADSYRSVVLAFQSAKKELNEDPMTANYDTKLAVADDIDQCETVLKKGVQIPEISSRNHLVYLYGNIADVITINLK